jgi:hypothetical protein
VWRRTRLDVGEVYVGARPLVAAGGTATHPSVAADHAASGVVTWAAEPTQPAAVPVRWEPLVRIGEPLTDYRARREAETRELLTPRLPELPVAFVRGVLEFAGP